MLVIFLGYKILILVFFRVFWKVLCRNEILVFKGLLVFRYGGDKALMGGGTHEGGHRPYGGT